MKLLLITAVAGLTVGLLAGCGGDGGNPPSAPSPSNTPFDSGLRNSGFVFIRQFPVEGTVPYFCIPHASAGMTGTVNVSSSSSTDTANVAVGPGGSVTFDPQAVTVRVGGHVRWTWISNNHTVTSGTPTLAQVRASASTRHQR